MFNSDFEKRWVEQHNELIQWFPEYLIKAIHPLFPNSINTRWEYPPVPTVHAMYLFGNLKRNLDELKIKFEMALEVGFFTEDENRFIDIAVWHNNMKHAIEVHGNTKDEERIKMKTKILEDSGWIVHNVYNMEIEEEDIFPHLINHLIGKISSDKTISSSVQ